MLLYLTVLALSGVGSARETKIRRREDGVYLPVKIIQKRYCKSVRGAKKSLNKKARRNLRRDFNWLYLQTPPIPCICGDATVYL